MLDGWMILIRADGVWLACVLRTSAMSFRLYVLLHPIKHMLLTSTHCPF